MRNKLVAVLLISTVMLSSKAFSAEGKYYEGYNLVAASMNTAAKENSISFYRNNQIVLFKPNPKGKNNKPVPFTSVIKANGDLGKPKLSKELGKLGVSGTIAFDSLTNTLYFSRYNSVEKDYALYEATVKGKKQAPKQLKIEGTGNDRGKKAYMVNAGWNYKTKGLTGFKNPSIAKDGNRIYFTARIRGKEYGNVGSTDIWFVDKKEDGSWTKPQNAGRNINTTGKDDYAFCVGDTVLYFSTVGKGVDIYKSKLVNGEWTKAKALAGPFNTNMNDFNMIMKGETIFLVSNRTPKGKDDIYLFRKKPDPVSPPPPISVNPEPEPEPIVQKMLTWNFVLFYFDFDKDVLSEEFTRQFKELVEEMKQFPQETMFEVAGHTDQRGSDKYNQKLSESRANFVKDMLVKEGFPKDKIKAVGFGETMPVVEDPKTDDDFAENRRCEIRILSSSEEIQQMTAPKTQYEQPAEPSTEQ